MIEAIIFDYARTIVNPDVNPNALYPDVIDVLDQLKSRGISMALVSRGQDESLRMAEIEQLGLTKYFSIIHIVGQSADKDFRPIIDQLKLDGTRCIVVGDRVKQEIKYGNQIGLQTVWLRREGGKFSNEFPKAQEEEPKFRINSLKELISIMENIN